MTLAIELLLADRSLKVKYTLTSYRALSDARSELSELENFIGKSTFLLSSWKVRWIGICSVLRAGFYVIQKDAQSCIHSKLKRELASSWETIKSDKESYELFWKFLKHQRDLILKQYQWQAYEVWLNSETGKTRRQFSLLDVRSEEEKMVLVMSSGPFSGMDSMHLLSKCANLLESTIFSAIEAAGFDPDEEVFVRDFAKVSEFPERQKTARLRQARANELFAARNGRSKKS